MSKTVAYLGPPGTFSQTALCNHFGPNCEQLPCGSIDEVFTRVEEGLADAGVVPVENSTEGIVNNTQDRLIDSPLKIVGEEVVPIEHHLMVTEGLQYEQITAIASHQQSLAQCRNWINRQFPSIELIECASNAEAARLAGKQEGVAAIAGSLAAEIYNLQILAEKIQDQDHNRTRFVILGNAGKQASGNDKTSAIIYTANKPGALFRVLEPFENLQISLTKIDSRPSKKAAWEYVFFIDFEGHQDDEKVAELFRRLQDRTESIKILGSYPMGNNS